MNFLLADDHYRLDELLTELFEALDAGHVRRSYEKLDIFWARLAMHIRAEHLHLFPVILSAVQKAPSAARRAKEISLPSLKAVKSRIAQLEDEHNLLMRELISAIKEIRRLIENGAEDSATRLIDVRAKVQGVHGLLEMHNELEESEVYRWADVLLGTEEHVDLSERMKKELDNLPPRFGK